MRGTPSARATMGWAVSFTIFLYGVTGGRTWADDAPPLPGVAHIPPAPGLLNLLGWWVAGGLVCALCVLCFRVLAKRSPKATRPLIILNYLIYCLVMAFLLVESYFHLFHVQTDIGCITLSSRHWFDRYWAPINEEGYRDETFAKERFADMHVLEVIGDSFAAGHGLVDYRKRFSGVVQSLLPSDWTVATVAQPGWDASDESGALAVLPIKPDVVVLSLYNNDLENIASNAGKDFESPLGGPSAPMQWLAAHSYAVSYALWSVYLRAWFRDNEHAYLDYLRAVQSDDAIWKTFEVPLRRFVDYSRSNGVPLVVVLFPMLLDVRGSEIFDARVRDYFAMAGVPVLYVNDLVENLPPPERVINAMDSHPSELVHERVGSALARWLREKNIVPATP